MASVCRRFLPFARNLYQITPRNGRTIVTPALINNAKCDQLSFCRRFCSTLPNTQKETVNINLVLADGRKETVKAKVGDNLLDVIVENELDVDGFGACEGTLACSTCHLIFKPADYEKLPETPTDEELDMLDLAYGLTDTSRLGCQVIVSKEMESWVVKVPAGVSDAREG